MVDKPEKKMTYMEALGMLQRVMPMVTVEDVADAINDTFDPMKVIELQDMLFAYRQHKLEAEQKELEQQATLEKPPAKKAGRK